jgi:TPR repeat protein
MKLRNVLLATLLVAIPTLIHADPAGDESRRQAAMATASASAAAIDRRNADTAFQAGLQQPSLGGGSGSSSSSSSSSSGTSGLGASGAYTANGPQSVVATRRYVVWVGETLAQAAVRLGNEATTGNAQSAYQLGRMYYGGYGVAVNLPEARRLFLLAADKAHVEGSTYAGQFLIKGIGGPIERTRGLATLFPAAEAGDPDAQAFLGVSYLENSISSGTTNQMPRAMNYLERAAEGGNALAQTTLGTLVYYFGTAGISEDGVKAVKYMRMAADQGEPMSMYYLGNLMVDGDPWTGENRTEGWSLISRAAQAGNGRAMAKLGLAKLQGNLGQRQDATEGTRLMRLSAEAGDRTGMFMYGNMLYTGENVAENKSVAIAFVKRSAEADYGPAQVMMGRMSYFGDVGLPKNLNDAARWAKLAAETGTPEGQTFYGQILYEGAGVPKDIREAFRWTGLAAAQGYQPAIKDLAEDPEYIALTRTQRSK